MPIINNMGGGAASHTPGPWTFDDDGEIRAYDEEGCLNDNIAVVYGDENGPLIAAAPELLRELEAAGCIFRAYEALHLEKGTQDGADKARRNAAFAESIERTIAKATLPAASDTVVSAHTALADEASSADKGGVK